MPASTGKKEKATNRFVAFPYFMVVAVSGPARHSPRTQLLGAPLRQQAVGVFGQLLGLRHHFQRL